MALIIFINTKALVRSIQGGAGVFAILHHNEVRVLYILGYITTFAWDLLASIAPQITELYTEPGPEPGPVPGFEPSKNFRIRISLLLFLSIVVAPALIVFYLFLR